MNLVGEMNAGFKIIKQGDKAVIGHKSHNGRVDEYAVWHYNTDVSKGETGYYWGRYTTDLEAAEIAFRKKERGEYSGCESE